MDKAIAPSKVAIGFEMPLLNCLDRLLLGSDYFSWAVFVFPIWVLLVSGYILIDNLSEAPSGAGRS